MKLTQPNGPSANIGTLTIFYKSRPGARAFDNTTFLSRDQITFVEDAGDTLHTQRNALDSGYTFDVKLNYAEPGEPAAALPGRGSRSVRDDRLGHSGFGKNEGDNEITGIHVSDGDPGSGESSGRRCRT